MTLPSLRKPRTTVRGRIIPGRTGASLAAGLLLLLGGIAAADTPGASSYNMRLPALPASLPLPATPVVAQAVPAPLPPPPPGDALPMVSPPQPVQAQWIAPGRRTPSAPSKAEPIQRVAFQQRVAPRPEESKNEYRVDIVPPGLQRLSQLDSDTKLQERIRQETIERTGDGQVVFPDEPILSREPYKDRVGQWPTRQMTVEPHFVNYRQIYFQQLNTERYGWDLGPISPLVCLGKFYYDVVTLPMAVGTHACERDSSTGYCLPGDPVPLLLYPPDITVQGVTLETAAIIALVAIFP